MENKKEIWKKVLSIIKQNTTDASYSHWFLKANLHSINEIIKIAYIESNDSFVVKSLNQRYKHMLESTLMQVMGEPYKVIVKESKEYENQQIMDDSDYSNTQIKKNKEKVNKLNNNLKNQRIFNPKYTFDNFIVGDCNELAFAVAKAVSDNPSTSYNPLFLHGNSGLGKTHLMHAMGIHLLENFDNINILYVSSEMFTNELIKSIQDQNSSREFKKKYRNLDVLLIDDIQFLEGKETTQIEFFNTFNDLYGNNKQIIISSDRPPNKLVRLDERLRSRFSWKMVAELLPADLETRVAILQKKAENEKIDVDDDVYEVIQLISQKIPDNIRNLEGAFNRVVSFANIMKCNIDVPFAKRILNDIIEIGGKKITPLRIKEVVSKYYNIKVTDLESSKRTNKVAYPRQIAMYLCRIMTDHSFPQIGKIFGDRHYTTVMHACDKIQAELKTDSNLKEIIEDIKKKINNVD
ncbi:MAG: chromosomal replication initiator protein DnaA [Hornefia sp.]|nr:chromosomal replication initiator protein DnaA [Hornefia sp.]